MLLYVRLSVARTEKRGPAADLVSAKGQSRFVT